MENIKSPAYPLDFPLKDYPKAELGFTKLELGALMIAAGMLNGWWSDGLSESMKESLSTTSVFLTKAILEEANK